MPLINSYGRNFHFRVANIADWTDSSDSARVRAETRGAERRRTESAAQQPPAGPGRHLERWRLITFLSFFIPLPLNVREKLAVYTSLRQERGGQTAAAAAGWRPVRDCVAAVRPTRAAALFPATPRHHPTS